MATVTREEIKLVQEARNDRDTGFFFSLMVRQGLSE